MSYPETDVYKNVLLYFESLHVGKFLTTYMKNTNLSVDARSTQLNFHGDTNTYFLNGSLIRESLLSAFTNPHLPTGLGYFIEWNAFRGISASFYEGMKDKSGVFATKLKNALGDKYLSFSALVEFVRHTLSHNIDDEIRVMTKDFAPLRERFKKANASSGILDLQFEYCSFDIFKDFRPGYGFKVSFDFDSINDGDRFISVVSEYSLFMLSELCFNLTQKLKP